MVRGGSLGAQRVLAAVKRRMAAELGLGLHGRRCVCDGSVEALPKDGLKRWQIWYGGPD